MFKLLPHIFSVKKTPKAPPYLIHFVEQNCNATCPHCFVYSKDYETVNKGKILNALEIDKVCKTLKGYLYSVIITGGEPFLRNDLEDICLSYLNSADVSVLILCTNGWFTEKTVTLLEKLTLMYPSKSFDVSISIDDIKELHDSFRGTKGGYDRAMSTYLKLMALGRKNLTVHINLTLNSENTKRANSIYNHLKNKINIESISISPASGFAKDKSSLDLNRKDYMNFMNSIKNDSLKENKKHIAGDLLSAKDRIVKYQLTPSIWKNGYQTPCYAGRLAGVIQADGNVYPCERLTAPIANLRDHNLSFVDLWMSHKAKKIRDWIWNTKCSCDHECFMTVNILFNPSQLSNIIREYLYIKYIRLRNKINL